MISGLTNTNKELVYNTALAVARQDLPNATNADIAEIGFQVGTIAGDRWSSPAGPSGETAASIRALPAYQKMIARVKATGTVYASTEDRALSPYAKLDILSPGARGGKFGFDDQMISGVPNYILYGGLAMIGAIALVPAGGVRKGKKRRKTKKVTRGRKKR